MILQCRGYYRCTHRHAQGCLATKQVQKSDEDEMICEITYKGRHTCTQSNKALPSKTKLKFGQNKSQLNQKIQPQEEKIQSPLENNFSIDDKEDIFQSFNFSSPSIGSENEDNNIFLETMIENNFMENEDNNIFSDSNIFCLSSLLDLDSTGLGPSESNITEIISGPNSIANSPMDFDLYNDINFDMDDFSINTQELCYWWIIALRNFVHGLTCEFCRSRLVKWQRGGLQYVVIMFCVSKNKNNETSFLS